MSPPLVVSCFGASSQLNRLKLQNRRSAPIGLMKHDGYPELIKATSFTIDGEAVVLGPDGLSRFDELSRREVAQTAILHAFDLIEHDGEDLRNLPFLDRKAALARLLVSKSVDGTYRSGPCRVWIKVRNPASVAVQRERSEIWNRRASGSARRR